MLERPGDGACGVFDVGGAFGLREESIIRRDDGEGLFFEELRDVFGTRSQPAPMEPDHRRKPFGVQGIVEVQFLSRVWILGVGDVLKEAVRWSLVSMEGFSHQSADEREEDGC